VTVRTLNFSTATVAGERVTFHQGRLMIRTSDTGRYEWEASGELHTVEPTLMRLSTGGDVRVEFDTNRDGTMSGQAFVEVSVSASQGGGARTYFRIRGTGELEGRPE
jgi:hypothetical protein